MKEKICYLIYTEYHLLLALDDIVSKYSNTDKFEVTLVLKRITNNNRLRQELNFDFLPYNVIILDFPLELNKLLSKENKLQFDKLLSKTFSIVIFFQEHDPYTIIFINTHKKNNSKIYLYQDGSKPYYINNMQFTFGMILVDLKQNFWIKKNGYSINNYFSFITCQRYGFLKGIDKLFLTFPTAYKNWNKLPIEQLSNTFSNKNLELSSKVFNWDDSLLEFRQGVIFHMNQPMNDDGSFELYVLNSLSKKYPNNKIIIKLHPLTPERIVNKYLEIKEVTIIKSQIPAELFVAKLTDSIILSLCSTSMFINNIACKFYWFGEIVENNNISKLKKYNLKNPTNHIMSVKSIDEIIF